MSTEEVSDIIKSSANYGVRLLKWKDLEIHFGPPAEGTPLQLKPTGTQLSADTNISAQQHARNNQEALRQNERELRELQIEELRVTDPLRAEEMIRNGEFEDANDESAERDSEFDE